MCANTATVFGVGLLATCGVALATDMTMQIGGGDITIASGGLPGLFASADAITQADLETLNDDLIANGVETEGFLNIMLAETARGLSLISMFDGDDGWQGDLPPLSLLGVQAIWSGQSDTSIVNLDAGGSWQVGTSGPDHMIGSGAFQWEQGQSWEAMALTELVAGQTTQLTLIDLGLWPLNEVLVQLVTFGGDQWSVAQTVSFPDEGNSLVLDGVVEIPAPAALSLLAIAGVVTGRRRRR